MATTNFADYACTTSGEHKTWEWAQRYMPPQSSPSWMPPAATDNLSPVSQTLTTPDTLAKVAKIFCNRRIATLTIPGMPPIPIDVSHLKAGDSISVEITLPETHEDGEDIRNAMAAMEHSDRRSAMNRLK